MNQKKEKNNEEERDVNMEDKKEMDFLQVKGRNIVKPDGTAIQLTGVGLGFWMVIEYMSMGIMGVENRARSYAKQVLGEEKAKVFFDSFMDHFISEKEIKYLADSGANVVRIPINYRHLESDLNPFHYLEEGFARLDKAIDWCEKYGIYAIIDLHTVPGGQNPDWHADSTARYAGFWEDALCQKRFIELWKVIAERYKGRSVVAGYELMNEPSTGQIIQLPEPYVNNWKIMNEIYEKTVEEIRKIDPDHIIILDGDNWSVNFDGLNPPFADNLVYSSHNYSKVEFLIRDHGGSYPGMIQNELWDRNRIREEFYSCQAVQYVEKHNVPLYIGECGTHHLINFFDDQLDFFNEFGAHWTSFGTVKDIGYVAMLRVKPDGEYFKKVGDFVDKFNPSDGRTMIPERERMKKLIHQVSDCIFDAVGDPSIRQYDSAYKLQRTIDDVYYANLVLPRYFQRFADMSKEEIADFMKCFDMENCIEHPVAGVIKSHFYKNQHTKN